MHVQVGVMDIHRENRKYFTWGLGKFHVGIFAVKKVSESCKINNFQVNKALVTPETYISCLFLSFRILHPFHHLPTHIVVTFSYFVQ